MEYTVNRGYEGVRMRRVIILIASPLSLSLCLSISHTHTQTISLYLSHSPPTHTLSDSPPRTQYLSLSHEVSLTHGRSLPHIHTLSPLDPLYHPLDFQVIYSARRYTESEFRWGILRMSSESCLLVQQFKDNTQGG